MHDPDAVTSIGHAMHNIAQGQDCMVFLELGIGVRVGVGDGAGMYPPLHVDICTVLYT